ncbi:hypothetical protein ABRY23_06065 [Melioribacteraceae bacterium 4301-Me]|uniref:hypothetical protein n=1 Tax=Pyranulibacter aquaticus TaxID=3163344 RepID=UPI00359A160B
MNSIYKYGFYAFIIISFSLFNMWNISRTRSKEELKVEKEKNEKRISSLLQSNIVLRRNIHEVTGYEPINAKNFSIIKQDSSYLIALLSDFDCSKCQENELLKLQKIKPQLETKGIKVVCITTKNKVNQIYSQMKFLKLNIPLYYVDDNILREQLSFDEKCPQVLLVEKGIVVSAFKPVTKDFQFSELFYERLLKKLQNTDGGQ